MKRFLRWMSGLSIYGAFSWFYDYVIYSWAIWQFGAILGGGVVGLISLGIDLATMKWYDWSQQDWFALEYLKSLRQYTGHNPLKCLISFLLTRPPKVIQVAVLSLRFNPFIVTTLMRSACYDYPGMTRRDWRVFLVSFVVGQTYWILLLSGALQGLRWMVK